MDLASPSPTIPEVHTKYLFVNLLRTLDCDLILDIGSRDGQDALIFKKARPKATVVALEANPYNFQSIAQNPDVSRSGVEVENLAVWNKNGHIGFNIIDSLQSCILPRLDLPANETVEVRCTRIDTFLKNHYTERKRIAIWMDIEGADYEASEGVLGCLDRVLMVHLETSKVPIHEGQKVFHDLNEMLVGFGFHLAGADFDGRYWGNVLYVKMDLWRTRDRGTRFAYAVAHLLQRLPRRRVTVFLLTFFPSLHKWLKRRFRHSPSLSYY